MKIARLIAAGVVAAAFLLPRASFAEDKPVVGLVMKSLANQYYNIMVQGAKAYEQKRGDFILKAVGMQSETDVDTQLNAIDSMITEHVNAIIVIPADSRALVPPIKRALEAGIPVIDMLTPLDKKAMQDAGIEVGYFGPDDREATRMVGDVLAKKLGPGGKVVILEGAPGVENGENRRLGFVDAVKNGGLDLLDSRTAHWETEEANTVFSNMLAAHPDIQGVMATNDSMAIGAIKAIESAGKTGQIQVVGFDNLDAVQPLLKEHKLLATLDMFAQQQAVKAIDLALAVIHGGTPLKGWIKGDIKLITPADAK
jgi:ribose transport system substrate-binding protein